jgi:hypothetical protein
MDILVFTIALPRAGTVVSSELYRSYPAANALPRVGALALSESNWTWRGGSWAVATVEDIVIGVGVARSDISAFAGVSFLQPL